MANTVKLPTPDILSESGDLKDPYRGFIAKSKYNRWDEVKGRRETWVETVNRYVDWMVEHQNKRGYSIDKETVKAVRHAITYHHIMPSMRALMTAGPALEKNHIAAYNCSAIAVDSIRAFDEALIVLMHGTGLGFSVENKYVDKLPEVAESFHGTTTVIRVEDSKEGWAKAFKEWLALLWSGQIPTYDVSLVRPKGERLRTFGGRASGPQPLVDLFEFTKDLLIKAAGRKITNLEAHDIMCKVAEVVVVGGTRRCLIATTKVQTPFGWTNISDLQVGDFIVRGGETAEVLAKVNSGVQDTLKVSFGIGNSITMTPNHRVAVFDSVDSYVFKEASELEVGDRLVWDLAGYDGEDQDLPQSEYKDHFNAKTVTIPGKVTPDIAWLIGQIHGDGYVGPKTLELSSNDNEFEYMERAQSILKSEFGLDSTVARDSHEGRGIRLRANSRKLALWLSSHVKTSNSPIAIPDFIVQSSREVRAAYLAGLLDSDGRIRSDGVIEQTTTVYPSYAEDLQALLSGLGIFSVAYTGSAQKRRDDGVLAQDYVTVNIRNLTSRLEYFRLVGPHSLTLEGEKLLSTKQARDFSYPSEFKLGYRNRATRRSSLIDSEDLNSDYQYAPVVITDIEYGGKHEVWDIEISNINEFTANGIVSHNSALISLSDLGSQDMAGAKSGAWWVNNPQRALANNSAIYTKTPNMDTFFREWKNIYDSKSGERGIVNLDAVKKHMDSIGRRDSSKATLTNPCLAGDAYLMTADGWITFKDAYGNGDPNDIVVDGRVQYTPSTDQKEHPDNWSLVKGEKYRPLTLPASEVFLTQKDAELVKVSLSNGMSVRLTPDHLVMTKSGMIPAGDLQPRDKVLITRGHLPHLPADPTPQHPRDRDAALMGLIAGDGTFSKGKTTEAVHIDLWGEDRWLAPKILEWINDLFKRYGNTEIHSGGNRPFTPYTVSEIPTSNKIRIGSSFLAAYLKKEYGFSRETKHDVPKILLNNASHSEARYYVAGLAFADGTVNKNSKVGSSNIRIGQSKLGLLQDVQRILLSNGISSSIYSRQPAGYSLLPDGHGGSKEYKTKEFFELVIMSQAYEYSKYVGFLGGHKDKSASEHLTPSRKQNTYSSVASVVPDGREDVYCLREDSRRILSANGITMRRCGEINLRDKEFCNLTEVVASAEDTKETLLEKIRLATILGTWQASLTDFKYLRRKWTENVREEALLGVSITGIYGNSFLNGSQGLEELASFLDQAREYSVEVNQKEASRIGINPAASVSCIKPSGCRPGDGLVTTDEGIFTLDELLTEHPSDETWASPSENLTSVQGDKITKTYRNGVAPVWKIKLSLGLEVESTPNHQWYVAGKISKTTASRRDSSFVPGWYRTDEIKPDYILDVSAGTYSNTSQEPLTQDIEDLHFNAKRRKLPTVMTEEFAWLLGYLWGDGTLSPHKSRVQFIDQNRYNLERVQRIFKDLFDYEGNILRASEGRDAYTFDAASVEIYNFLVANGIWKYKEDGTLADIPLVVRKSSYKSILAFIAGIVDSDGCVFARGNYRGITIATAYDDFAKHLQNVALSVGVALGRSHNTQGINLQENKSIWLMTANGNSDESRFLEMVSFSGKASHVLPDLDWAPLKKGRRRYIMGRVVSSEFDRYEETYDVEVENSHWFYAGAVKSHNTVSQLTGTSSGIHPWHAHNYIRRVRGSNHDPLVQLLKDAGVSNEPEIIKPQDTTVFSFPISAPEGAIVQEDITALQHLELWRTYRNHWTEHNPSVTITVREHEWLEVGAYVFKYFDQMSGVSFLPDAGNHTYQQAPFEAITPEEYKSMMENRAIIPWEDLSLYELEDTTTGNKELACTAGACEVVDLEPVEETEKITVPILEMDK